MKHAVWLVSKNSIFNGAQMKLGGMFFVPLLFLGACGGIPATEPLTPSAVPATGQPASNSVKPFDRSVKVSAVGYGAMNSFDGYTPGQKRLMAIRASKLDAYRALVEQVYGVRITSNTTVAGLVAQSDSFRVYVDAYLRGAKVLSVTPLAEGNYETALEIELGESFYNTMLQPAAPHSSDVPACSPRGEAKAGCSYGSDFYHAE